MAPGTPHIQNQNTSAKMTSTGFNVKRRAKQHRRQGFALDEVDAEVEARRQQSPR